jgi:hypothetical protein
VLIFFLSSEGVVSPPSTAVISSWTNGTTGFPDTPAQDANQTRMVDAASPQEAKNTTQVPEILIIELYLSAQSVFCVKKLCILLPRLTSEFLSGRRRSRSWSGCCGRWRTRTGR